MKKTSFIITMVITAALVSCNEVPKDVESRTQESRTEIIAETDLEAISVNTLQTDAEAALHGDYSQFKLRNGIKADIPDEL